MRLLEESIYRELPELMERNVRLRVIGRPHRRAAAGAPRHRPRRARDAGQHRVDPADGLQLRRPRRAARRLPRAGARRCRRASSSPRTSRRSTSARRSTPTASRIRICSSAPAARCGSRTSCCGRSPTPSCGSRRPCGRISAPVDLYRAIAEFQGGRAASVGCDVADAAAASVALRGAGSVRAGWKRVASAVVLIPVFVLVVIDRRPAWMFHAARGRGERRRAVGAGADVRARRPARRIVARASAPARRVTASFAAPHAARRRSAARPAGCSTLALVLVLGGGARRAPLWTRDVRTSSRREHAARRVTTSAGSSATRILLHRTSPVGAAARALPRRRDVGRRDRRRTSWAPRSAATSWRRSLSPRQDRRGRGRPGRRLGRRRRWRSAPGCCPRCGLRGRRSAPARSSV